MPAMAICDQTKARSAGPSFRGMPLAVRPDLSSSAARAESCLARRTRAIFASSGVRVMAGCFGAPASFGGVPCLAVTARPCFRAWPCFAVRWAALLPRRTRALGYSLRPNHLMARQGLLFRHVTSIPYGRIQYVDVDSGPLERAHHLVRLTIRTAGVTASKVTLYGIPTERGQQLRELLIRRADERMAAL